MFEGFSGLAPIAALCFVAACLLWLLWRAFRSLLGPRSTERREPEFAAPAAEPVRREPALVEASRASAPVVPDAADILALKASIDALTKQIGALERRLAPANSNIPGPESAPPPAAARKHIDALAEVPLVVPERIR